MKKKIRYGYHPFINSQPFIYPLTSGIIDHNFELISAPPALIAEQLKHGELDIAFIPSIEYMKSDYLLFPDHSISSKGRVDSVLLCSKKTITEVSSIALDIQSRTSIAMLKILLTKKYATAPELFYNMKPDITHMMSRCDAALIIGDNALKINREQYRVYDLGEEWYSCTGSSFVHAILAVRPDVDLGDSVNTLFSSKKIGLEQRKTIAENSPLGYQRCLDYLTDTITYDLGDEELKGLEQFYSLAKESNVTTDAYEIKFYDTGSS